MPNIASASFISLLEQCSGSCESRSADVDSDATYQHVLNTIASYVILTLSFYALMGSCVIGAIEGIKIITYNITVHEFSTVLGSTHVLGVFWIDFTSYVVHHTLKRVVTILIVRPISLEESAGNIVCNDLDAFNSTNDT